MTAFHDDDLRSMIEARADRLAPSTAGRVMSGVRDEIRGPRQGAAFSVLPVLTGRTPAFGVGWVAAAMIAVLAIAVMATRPQIAAPSQSAPAAVTVAPSSAQASGFASLLDGLTREAAILRAVAQMGGMVSADSLSGATAGAFGEVKPAGAAGPSVPPEQLVWAVSFDHGYCTIGSSGSCESLRYTVFLDYVTGDDLGLLITNTDASAPVITPADLQRVRKDGSADGDFFLVDGLLHGVPNVSCAAEPCVGYALEFIGSVATGAQPDLLPVTPASLPQDFASEQATFIVMPWKGKLILVGRADVNLATPLTWEQYGTGFAWPNDPSIPTIAVEGTLRQLLVECPSATPDQPCPSAELQLTDSVEETPSLGVIVRVSSTALVAQLANGAVSGPFLLRPGLNGDPSEIVAAYDPSRVTTVTTPTITCDSLADNTVPTCWKLIDLAMQQVDKPGDVTAVMVRQGIWPCPVGTTCPTPPPGPTAYVTVTTASVVSIYGLAFDERGNGTAIVLLSHEATVVHSYQPITGVSTCREMGYGQSSAVTCAAAVAAALKVIPAGTDVVSTDFEYGTGCPPGYWCFAMPASPDPNSGHVIVHVAPPGPDLWVNVTANAAGTVTADPPMSYPTAAPSPSAAP